MKSYCILVAFTVTAPDMEQAQKQLMPQLPNPSDPGVAGIDSWYIAMNERYDGTHPRDGASARFVSEDNVCVNLDYDDAILLYELLSRDVCQTELVNSGRRERAAQWARTIFDAIDNYERGGV
jgi:hypothetical protein